MDILLLFFFKQVLKSASYFGHIHTQQHSVTAVIAMLTPARMTAQLPGLLKLLSSSRTHPNGAIKQLDFLQIPESH